MEVMNTIMEVVLFEDDRNLIQSIMPKWESTLKILLLSLLVVRIVIGIFIGANLIAYNSYTSIDKVYREKNELLDKSQSDNSEATELSEYIKTQNPKIYRNCEKEKYSAH